MWKVKGKDKWKQWDINLSISMNVTRVFDTVRLEYNINKNIFSIIPLNQTISVHNGDVFNLTITAGKCPQTTLLAWMWSRFNRQIQVRLGLRNEPNSWNGQNFNVYQSLFHLERSSGGGT